MWIFATILSALSVFRVIETPDLDPSVYVDAPLQTQERGEYLLITWKGKGNRCVIDILTKDFVVDTHAASGNNTIRFPIAKGSYLSYRVKLYEDDLHLSTYSDPMWVDPIQ